MRGRYDGYDNYENKKSPLADVAYGVLFLCRHLGAFAFVAVFVVVAEICRRGGIWIRIPFRDPVSWHIAAFLLGSGEPEFEDVCVFV